jgi:hypothetical protein
MLQNAYGNLTEAYLLSGSIDQAMSSREKAWSWVKRERSWLARVIYAAEEGCHQLILGNLSATLDIALEAERLASGRERAVPASSSYEMLKTLRLFETEGVTKALAYAAQAKERYRQVPLAYVDAAVMESWLCRKGGREAKGGLEDEASRILEKLPGRKNLYVAMGLLR